MALKVKAQEKLQKIGTYARQGVSLHHDAGVVHLAESGQGD